MKWTRQILRSQIALTVLCLSFSSPTVQASEVDKVFRGSALTGASPETESDKVTGRVSAVDGEPLAGASVMIKGTKIGTTADIDGNYSRRAPSEG